MIRTRRDAAAAALTELARVNEHVTSGPERVDELRSHLLSTVCYLPANTLGNKRPTNLTYVAALTIRLLQDNDPAVPRMRTPEDVLAAIEANPSSGNRPLWREEHGQAGRVAEVMARVGEISTPEAGAATIGGFWLLETLLDFMVAIDDEEQT